MIVDEQRLVNAAEVLYRLYESGTKIDREHADPHFVNGIMTAIEIIRGVPTVDAEPVVHAHWYIDRYGIYHCSKCDGAPLEHETGCFVNRHYEQELSNFCPRCGAHMDEEVRDGQTD